MRRISYVQAAFWGAFTGAGVVALTYLGHDIFHLPYVASDFFEFTTRLMPGPLVTTAIDLMVRVIIFLRLGPTGAIAKQAESALAVAGFLTAGAFFGLVILALWESGRRRLAVYGLAGGFLFTAISMIVNDFLGFNGAAPLPSLVWLLVIYLGWGLALARLIAERVLPQAQPSVPVGAEPSGNEAENTSPPSPQPAAPRMSRRQFLLLVIAGVFTSVVTALRVNSQRTAAQAALPASATPGPGVDASNTTGPAQSPAETALQARFPPVPGTRQELTPADKFYRVDINLEPPSVDPASWRLAVDGLVDKPLSLTLDDLRALPAYSQAITLECISNPVGGDLISTGVWKGARLKDVLALAGMQPTVKAVYIEAADSFYESVLPGDIQDERTLLVYEMDGQPLTVEHGSPLRIYIPNRHGMKQPKWIVHLKAIDIEGSGYWVDRGWSPEAIVNTTSVIDIVAVDERDQNSGRVPVGGIAYSGAGGISKVEIKVDDNPWQAAELRDPPLSPLTWVQWRYFWQPTPGKHTLYVRATDGAGELQRVAENDTFPNGATGYHRVTVKI
jgi:DMSO/TMAO reductase YedYZ molybdopterin-dependent catalytic subunit